MLLPEAFVKEIEGDPQAKRRRMNEGNFGLEGYKATDEVWFQSQKTQMAVEAGEKQAMLDAPENPLLIQNGSASDAQSGNGVHVDSHEPEKDALVAYLELQHWLRWANIKIKAVVRQCLRSRHLKTT